MPRHDAAANDPRDDLTLLPNIGPKLADALAAAGIQTPTQLRGLGSVEAWRRIHPTFDCLSSLQSLEGAIQGIPKAKLDDSARARLAAAFAGR